MLSIFGSPENEDAVISPNLAIAALVSASILFGASVVGLAHRLRGEGHMDIGMSVIISASSLGSIVVYVRHLRFILGHKRAGAEPPRGVSR
jgi:membrane protein YqaA with SNARE-associated domain